MLNWMFEEYMTRSIPDITPVAMQKAKDTNFAEWCKDYDDRRDQVAESSLLRVETHVVDDVSYYDLAPVNPPNDEYVSDVEVVKYVISFLLSSQHLEKKRQTLSLDSRRNGSSPLRFLCRRLRFNLAVSDSIRRLRFHLPPLMMNSTRAPGTQAASPPMPLGATVPAVYHAGSPPMPPGATGAAPNHAASSSRSNSYPQMTLNAMLNSPARLSQPHLHPDKPNGAIWNEALLMFVIILGLVLTHVSMLSSVQLGKDTTWVLGRVEIRCLRKGRIPGGKRLCEQFREHAPSSRVPNGIASNLDLEMHVGGLETTLQSVTSDVAGVKQDVSDMRQDFAATREAINQLLQTLRPPQAPTGQTSDHQAQAPTGQPNPPNGI
ncbi:hypothetical protein IGI04_019053 [Brassica rapa subsp. trilocularis]|uniref:Uncharacterized protein n=1 Tax=Brassica rapa subsp. trilocularis TaxID=1813537 RepID=A0ABQ7MEQ3_BRACM|nr:hypothetical protein IGI04_019053 [Brassica rapa subsp. trilocularis]